jgi:hypothetical protein
MNSEILVVGLTYKSIPIVKISLNFLTDSIKCHVSANKMTTRVNLNKKI